LALGQDYVAPVVLFDNSRCGATARIGSKVTRRVSEAIIVIRAAISAPYHRSRLHAFVGWCLGFFVIDGAVFAAIGVAILVPQLLK